MKHFSLRISPIILTLFFSFFVHKGTSQVLHVDYIQTAGTLTSYTIEVWVSKTSPEPMLLSALNTVFTYPNGTLTAGTVTAPLVAPFNTLQTLASSYIAAQLKVRATQTPSGSPATSISVTNTPQLFCTFTVTSTTNIAYPLNITPATGGNPTLQAIVYHNGSANSVALTLIGGTITTDENPLTLQLLPVKLHDFSVEKNGERRAKLNWNTSSEINASHFGVERSFDAENFDQIGEVKASGNSNDLKHYLFYDEKVPSLRTETIVYYRLKMVDLDGSFEYSDIRGVNFGKSSLEGIQIYPNPAVDLLNIDVTGLESKALLMILSNDGKVLLNKNIIGNGIETVDMTRFVPGLYQVIIKNEDLIYQDKIVKID